MSNLQTLDDNPNEAVSKLLDKYQAAEEECIPVINPNSIKKLRPKWFNKEIKQLVTMKFSIFCQIRAGAKCEDIKVSYKMVCKDIKLAVRIARLSYESILVAKCKCEPKMLYSYINNQKA
jgi:hypothetical protein